MAGVWARSDAERGVHKAPANEIVRGAVDLELQITKRRAGPAQPDRRQLHPRLPRPRHPRLGRPHPVLGPGLALPERAPLFNYLEESILIGTQWVVFEPNDQALWARVRRNISAFLVNEWRNGALFGHARRGRLLRQVRRGDQPAGVGGRRPGDLRDRHRARSSPPSSWCSGWRSSPAAAASWRSSELRASGRSISLRPGRAAQQLRPLHPRNSKRNRITMSFRPVIRSPRTTSRLQIDGVMVEYLAGGRQRSSWSRTSSSTAEQSAAGQAGHPEDAGRQEGRRRCTVTRGADAELVRSPSWINESLAGNMGSARKNATIITWTTRTTRSSATTCATPGAARSRRPATKAGEAAGADRAGHDHLRRTGHRQMNALAAGGPASAAARRAPSGRHVPGARRDAGRPRLRPRSAATGRRVRQRDTLRTEFEFELPRGYVDESGTVHRRGSMRLPRPATSCCPLRDVRVRENPAYLSVVLLGRVITRLGTLRDGPRRHRGEHVRLRPGLPPGLLPADQRRGPHPGGRWPARTARRPSRSTWPGAAWGNRDVRGRPARARRSRTSPTTSTGTWTHILDLEHGDRRGFVTGIAGLNARASEG